MDNETNNELSLQDKIAAAHVAFRCACGSVAKAVAWREYARLVRKRDEPRRNKESH